MNTMLLEAGTHVLRELRVLMYLSPFFMPAAATSSGLPRGANWALGGTPPRLTTTRSSCSTSNSIVIVIVITTYHAVYWCYRASRTDRWLLPCSIPWVPGLPEVAHSMTEDPENRGYRPARLWGQWQLQSISISNGDGRWPVGSPGVTGQGMATQQHSNKQKARAPPMGAT